MTDETEAVAGAICKAATGVDPLEMIDERPAWSFWESEASAAITTLDRHRIEGAGELEQALRDDNSDQPYTERHEAAATIASLRAEIERLTEREAQAKLNGVRAGIEASIREADEHARQAWAIGDREGQSSVCSSGRNYGARAVGQAIRALSAEAIAMGEG